MNREQSSVIKPEVALSIQEIATNTTTVGEIIDTRGFDAQTFIIQAGTLEDGSYLPSIVEGDDSALSDESAVADADLTTTEVLATVDESDEIKKIGYKGSKRYIRCDIVSSATASGGDIGVISVKGLPANAPVA